jgi:hypothetical protein
VKPYFPLQADELYIENWRLSSLFIKAVDSGKNVARVIDCRQYRPFRNEYRNVFHTLKIMRKRCRNQPSNLSLSPLTLGDF